MGLSRTVATTDGCGLARPPVLDRRSSSRSGIRVEARRSRAASSTPVIAGISMSVRSTAGGRARRPRAGAPRLPLAASDRRRSRLASRTRRPTSRIDGSSSTTSTVTRLPRARSSDASAASGPAGAPPRHRRSRPPCPRGGSSYHPPVGGGASSHRAGARANRANALSAAVDAAAPSRDSRSSPAIGRARGPAATVRRARSSAAACPPVAAAARPSASRRSPRRRRPPPSRRRRGGSRRAAASPSARPARGEDRRMRLDRADPLADDDRPELTAASRRLRISIDRRRQRPVRQDRQPPRSPASRSSIAPTPGGARQGRRRRRGCTPRPPTRSRPGRPDGAAALLVPALVRRLGGAMPRSRAKTRTSRSAEIDLAELRDLLAELPLALLRPGRQERRAVDPGAALDDRVGGQLDDPPQRRPARPGRACCRSRT